MALAVGVRLASLVLLRLLTLLVSVLVLVVIMIMIVVSLPFLPRRLVRSRRRCRAQSERSPR